MIGKLLLPMCFFLLLSICSWSQDTSIKKASDSLPPAVKTMTDSMPVHVADMETRLPQADLSRFPRDTVKPGNGQLFNSYAENHPYYKAVAKASQLSVLVRRLPATDWIFYIFCGLLLFLGFLKIAFPKYFHDFFRVFFNSSLRQKQIREQLIQEPLPSLMLNIFFGLSAGLFLYFVLASQGWDFGTGKWISVGICVLLVLFLYAGKFILLRFMGWVFGIREEAETYSFIVFLVNKMIGLVLLPAGILLALFEESEKQSVMLITAIILGALLVYRMIKSYLAIHTGLKINQLHFLIYVFAFEVVPVLLLYKVLFKQFA
jgi:hypothetical protein